MSGHVVPSSLNLKFISPLKSLLDGMVLGRCFLFLPGADLDDRSRIIFKIFNHDFLPVTCIPIILTSIAVFHSSSTASLYLVNRL